jgi:hypothetical protein
MTFDDSLPAECRQEETRLARIEEGRSLVVGEPEESTNDQPEREMAAHYLAMRRHDQTCQWLRVNSENVTPLDLTSAALTEDPSVQFSRLQQLFEACGVLGENRQTEREDLICTIAEYGPQNDRERTILYHQKAAERMAARCSAGAMATGVLPQVTALHANSFSKLVRIDNELGDRLDAMRGRAGPSAREVRMGVALFATARSPIATSQHEAAALPRRASSPSAIGRSSEHMDKIDGASAGPPGWDLL